MGQVAPNHPVCAPGAGEADPLIFCAHLLPNETVLEGLMASHRQARPWPPDLGKPLPLTRAPACFSAGVEGERGLRRAWTWVQPRRSPSRSNLCLGFLSARGEAGMNAQCGARTRGRGRVGTAPPAASAPPDTCTAALEQAFFVFAGHSCPAVPLSGTSVLARPPRPRGRGLGPRHHFNASLQSAL